METQSALVDAYGSPCVDGWTRGLEGISQSINRNETNAESWELLCRRVDAVQFRSVVTTESEKTFARCLWGTERRR